MKIRELFGFAGIPMAHTAKPQGLKKVTKSYMGKVRTIMNQQVINLTKTTEIQVLIHLKVQQ